MNKSKIFLNAFYKPDEKLLLSKVLDQAFLCTRDGKNKYTDFFNFARYEDIVEVIKSNFDVNISLFGGLERSEHERLKIGFSPTYYELENSEFPIESIEIKYNKFSKDIKHRELLGSILGLGIDRGKIGDILIFDTRAIVFVDRDIADYICANLESVGRNKVEASIKHVEDLYIPLAQYQDIKITVTSMNLSSIISAGFNMSRSKSAELIKGKKAFINWEKSENTSKALKQKDTITVRGYGRLYINEVIGKSSKGKTILNIHKYG